MGLMKLIQLLIILLCFVQESKIQIISQKLEQSEITVGDKIKYTLVVEHNKDTVFTLVNQSSQLLNPKPIVMASENCEVYGPDVKQLKGLPAPRLSARNAQAGKSKQRNGILKLIEYKITVYEPGAYNIPPIIIKCRDANGREFSVMSQPLGFSVRSVRSNDAQTIRDIKAPEGVPRDITPYILILGIIIVGFIVATYFYFKRRKVSITVKPETVILQRLPHEIALEELHEIELMGLVAKGEIKEYCTRISDVIRRYIEKRYGIAAMELTTAKILDALETIWEHDDSITANEEDSLPYQRGGRGHVSPFDRGGILIDKIGDFLNACDSVKFAKYQPSADEAGNLLQQARKIVEIGISSAIEKDFEYNGE
jgi:hypothetical protein